MTCKQLFTSYFSSKKAAYRRENVNVRLIILYWGMISHNENNLITRLYYWKTTVVFNMPTWIWKSQLCHTMVAMDRIMYNYKLSFCGAICRPTKPPSHSVCARNVIKISRHEGVGRYRVCHRNEWRRPVSKKYIYLLYIIWN